jgi:competence protein ComEA
MKLFDLREASARAVFWLNNIKYTTKRHHMLAVFVLVLIMLIIFSAVFISQKNKLERNQKILKSFYEDAGEEDREQIVLSPAEGKPVLIKIHVCGEVNVPAVYEVEEGSRVIDLIGMAGGPKEAASIDSLNLAQEVFDGQKIYVPSRDEIVQGGSLGSGAAEDGTSNKDDYKLKININTATSGQLKSLPGIGPVTADKIIMHREKYGHFSQKEDLMDVNGIGPKKFEQVKDLIDV